MSATPETRIARFATWAFLRLVAVVIATVALVRSVIPYLVNQRDDALLFVAVLLAVFIPILIGWVGLQFYFDVRRFLKKITDQGD